MSAELIIAAAAWIAAALLGALGRGPMARALLAVGALALPIAAFNALPNGSARLESGLVLTAPVSFRFSPAALWLMGFGALPVIFAAFLGSPTGRGGWSAGAALALLGGLGVFGAGEGATFLIAWELMSLGGALMILSERSDGAGTPVLFMLTLLELGTVALMAAVLILGKGHGLDFARFHAAAATLTPGMRYMVGVLFIIGFGAKLGLLPFYEWFPNAYGKAGGATGALLSGIVLNAAYFGLARGLTQWLPGGGGAGLAIALTLLALAVLTAVFAILYAFQAEDWRQLLSLSTAENAAVACAALAACLLFQHAGLARLAGLGWLVALLHLAGHSLAKGTLFLTADGVYRAVASYRLQPIGLLRRSHWIGGAGALVAVMSLAAMPPTAGFVSEWFVFQTVFQGYQVPGLTTPLALAIAGAGLALTAAVALATFVKAMGVGLLGDGDGDGIGRPYGAAIGVLGLSVLITAVVMPWLLPLLNDAVQTAIPGADARALRDGWLLVPLTSHFAFISPTKLIIAGPLLALVPLGLLAWSKARRRRAPAWYGALPRVSARTAITPLAFSNALRTFYSLVYRPTQDVTHEHIDKRYFLRRLSFDHKVAPIFGPSLFAPATRLAYRIAARLQALQSGNLNLYLAIIGLMMVITLCIPLF